MRTLHFRGQGIIQPPQHVITTPPPMHPPMHQPMHSPACPSTKIQIDPTSEIHISYTLYCCYNLIGSENTALFDFKFFSQFSENSLLWWRCFFCLWKHFRFKISISNNESSCCVSFCV